MQVRGRTFRLRLLSASHKPADVVIVQQGEAQRDGEQIEEVIVPREDDEDLEQNLHTGEAMPLAHKANTHRRRKQENQCH